MAGTEAGDGACAKASGVSGGSISAGPAVSLREQQKQSGTQDEVQASADPVAGLSAAPAAAARGSLTGSHAASSVMSAQTATANSRAASRRAVLRQTHIEMGG